MPRMKSLRLEENTGAPALALLQASLSFWWADPSAL
jgi:hypothetical protein